MSTSHCCSAGGLVIGDSTQQLCLPLSFQASVEVRVCLAVCRLTIVLTMLKEYLRHDRIETAGQSEAQKPLYSNFWSQLKTVALKLSSQILT